MAPTTTQPETTLPTSLAVPADMRFLPMLRCHIRSLATLATYTEPDILGLELAAEEAFANIIQHAYPGQRPGQVFCDGEITTHDLVLTIRDEGLPLDPQQVMAESLAPVSRELDYREVHLGLKLIRHAVDDASFQSLGRRGKMLRLVKRLPGLATPPLETGNADLAPAPPQSYQVRSLRREDLVQVMQLFWLTYGFSYVYDSLYDPGTYWRQVESGQVISLVAVGEDGLVAAHGGLVRHPSGATAEQALLAVSPAHRGRGLMPMIFEAGKAKALEAGLLGMSICPVTSHAISQKDAISRGAVPCGLELAVAQHVWFKSLVADDAPPRRETLLHCFYYLSPPPPAQAHLPAHHQEMVARIYQQLGRPHRFGQPGPPESPGRFQATLDHKARKGIIQVDVADPGQWPEIRRAARDLEEMGEAQVVYLDLPLEQPATALVCQQAEDAGFFYSCLRPCEGPDGADVLRLQRLNIPYDLSPLQVCPGLAQDLLSYIAAAHAQAQKRPRW